MDLRYERNLEINEWIITTRWFYMVAVFLIGILGNSLISLFAIDFSFFSIIFLLLIVVLVNAYFYSLVTGIKKIKSVNKLKYLSIAQIAIELVVFSIILHLGGDKAISSLFFFLPIISASTIFGIRGALITAVLSASLVNISVVIDYYQFLFNNILNKDIFNVLDATELRYNTIALIKTISTSNFYLILAIFSGYGSKLLYGREQKLMSQAESLVKVTEYRENEWKQLEKTTKLLVKRDLELTAINKELDKKIKDLERSEKSMLGAFSDLKSERKKSEEERNKTAAIISNFIDPIIVIDKYNKLNLLNPAAKEIFGFIDDDLGKEVDSTNNYSLENFKTIIKQSFEVHPIKEGGIDNSEEEVAIIIDGQEHTYKVITADVKDIGYNPLGVMKIFYNLTREKMIDKLKSEFISIAAHQLRTPLSAIKWVIKMVLDGDAGKLNEEQEKLLFKGYQSNERIIVLVNDMLNVSRIDEGRFGYEFTSTRIEDIVQEHIDALENLMAVKKIQFVFKKSDNIPPVSIDKQKMGLAVQNLLENAVKYTPEYGRIEVGLEAGDKYLTIRVKDNGVGIPEKDQEKLFSKFFRAENVLRMQTEGSGLGLFIVKNIIKKHGGEISFTSKEGAGTEFVFTIPLAIKKK
jgi:PAS domain S-box-containing protein